MSPGPRVLLVQQPWAWAMVRDWKRGWAVRGWSWMLHENCESSTNYRGAVYIQASSTAGQRGFSYRLREIHSNLECIRGALIRAG